MNSAFDDSLVASLEKIIDRGYRDTLAGKKMPEKIKRDDVFMLAWNMGRKDAEEKKALGLLKGNN